MAKLLKTLNCPNCGGVLNEVGECKFCGSKVYDFTSLNTPSFLQNMRQNKIKGGKSFRCEVLDWHKPTTIYVKGLSITFESTCKRCGRPIMQDSQGNWFSVGLCNSAK